jgi:hypothetical protein
VVLERDRELGAGGAGLGVDRSLLGRVIDASPSGIKHDGYRLQVRREGDTVRLFTRRGYDWSKRYPAIAARRLLYAARRSRWTARPWSAAQTASRSSMPCNAAAPSARPCCTRSTSWSLTGKTSPACRWATEPRIFVNRTRKFCRWMSVSVGAERLHRGAHRPSRPTAYGNGQTLSAVVSVRPSRSRATTSQR